MKFHNQRSFMGHEISNVNNKPLLHKKGKQWIVVAVSALILAGFGGMVSTTTHADTMAAQPTTTKVAPKPANVSAPKATQPNAKNISQQATNLHKNLVNNSINAPRLLGNAPATTNPTSSGHFGANGTWTAYNDNSIQFHGHGTNWNDGGFNLAPYSNIYISDVHFHGPGHMFSGLTNLKSITFAKNVTNDAQYMDNDFNGDINLQTINGLNNFMDNDTNLIDYDFMFNDCKSLQNLDLTGLNSKNIPTSGQSTYTGDGHTGDGNYQAFNGTPSLRGIKLGQNSILYSDSGISPYAIPQTNIGNFTRLDDGQPHANLDGTPRTWNLCDNGTWNTAHWYLNRNNGALKLSDGTISTNPNDAKNATGELPWNKVTSITTSDITAPTSLHINNNVGTFGGLSDLQSIDLSGMKIPSTTTSMGGLFQNDRNLRTIKLSPSDTSNVNDMSWMFAGDYNLKDLDLSGLHFSNNTNISAMFDSDNNDEQPNTYSGLQSLTLPDSFNDSNNQSNVFGAIGSGTQAYNLSKLTLGSHTRLGSGSLPQCSWVNLDTNTQLPSNDLTNGTHSGTWYGFKETGTWDTATWYLLNNNNLLLANGELLKAGTPTSRDVLNANGILTHNVTAPSDSSNLFSQFTKANPIDLTGMDFTNANNISNMFSKNNKLAVKFNNTIDWDLYKNLNSDNSKLSSLSDKTNSASTSASNADDWVKNNSNSAQSADSWVHSNSASLSNASTNASKALTSLATDQNYITWLKNNESNLSNGASQASSNATWIENNSASVKNITLQINSLNTKISDDSSALNTAINTKADSTSVSNDENDEDTLAGILSDDINNLDNLDDQANSLASADEDWIDANSNTAASGISNDNASASASASAANANADSYALSLANNATDTANVNAGGIDNTINTNDQTVQSLSNTVNANTESLADNEDNLYQTKADKPAKKQSIKKVNGNLFYFYVIKPMWLHTSAKFTKGNRVKALTAKHGYTLPITRIFKVNGALRFEVKINGTKYFVTGRKGFARNAYIQPNEIKRNSSIKVLRNIREYKRAGFDKKNFIRNFKRGSVLPIKRAKTIAGKQVTRLQLTNGHWITANKNLVKLI